MDPLLKAHTHASNHHEEIEASTLCGCFACLQIFPPSEIIAWTGLDSADFSDLESVQGATALCPRCGSEAVIGDKSGFPITPDFLNRMSQAWMQRTVVRPRPKK
ncbi:MAG: cytoplasmic protein [Rubrivivax sp.]|nr:cytoplasmic protein [Rubrivivax sp.]